jgi:hypothetical protein
MDENIKIAASCLSKAAYNLQAQVERLNSVAGSLECWSG